MNEKTIDMEYVHRQVVNDVIKIDSLVRKI